MLKSANKKMQFSHISLQFAQQLCKKQASSKEFWLVKVLQNLLLCEIWYKSLCIYMGFVENYVLTAIINNLCQQQTKDESKIYMHAASPRHAFTYSCFFTRVQIATKQEICQLGVSTHKIEMLSHRNFRGGLHISAHCCKIRLFCPKKLHRDEFIIFAAREPLALKAFRQSS